MEAALYALFVCGNEYRQELWLRRDENDSTKRDFRKKFTAGNVLNHLRTVDPKMGRIARSLYDHTLDYGAHPNRDSILPLVERVDSKDEVEHRLKYLAGEGLPFENALRTTAQVGLVALRILRNVYKERFNIMGFTDRIEKASIGL